MDKKVVFNQIYQYSYPVNGSQPQKKTLGNRVKSERVCIFCNRGMDDVTFKKEAHIIPAALGNKSLFNYDECDE
ncbi:HNH endonuclease, partial [Priestia megaterium]